MTNDVTDELRAAVAQRASSRCEYCLIDEHDTGFAHQVDHIVSRKHGGLSTLDNACFVIGTRGRILLHWIQGLERLLDCSIPDKIDGPITSDCMDHLLKPPRPPAE